MSQYFKIGKFAASHGLTGELVLVHGLGKKTALKDLEALFIETSKDNFMPYFIESTSVKNDAEVYVKIEGIDTKEVARKFTPKEVWMAAADFDKFAAKTSPISMLGYDLIDGENNLGEIIEVIEQPHQILCAILYKGNEALIPVHEKNLIKMDQKNKKVYVEVPDGLLDIYG
ncbi:MAG: 16S rRNA processing protein RimM [Gloeobacteraceae cyanobacterium ES-bin-316]|nr:16S rRNA processing protein RimM [Ferruginibacter sp.]